MQKERRRIPINKEAIASLQNPIPFKRKKSNYSNVTRRILAYRKENQLPIYVTHLMKQEIGNLVKEKFFNDPHKKNKGAFKKEVREPEGTFSVLFYPAYFFSTIDEIISEYFKKYFNDRVRKN